jgi:hypothetical protein
LPIRNLPLPQPQTPRLRMFIRFSNDHAVLGMTKYKGITFGTPEDVT